MAEFYTKHNGKYIPIKFNKIVTKDWNNKLIYVRIGTDEHPAEESEIDEALECLSDAEALSSLDSISFLVSLHNIDFEIMDNLSEIGKKCISIRVTGGDDLSKLGNLQKKAKEQLKGKTKKVVIMPSPITIEEYVQVKEVLDRLKTRRNRRSK